MVHDATSMFATNITRVSKRPFTPSEKKRENIEYKLITSPQTNKKRNIGKKLTKAIIRAKERSTNSTAQG